MKKAKLEIIALGNIFLPGETIDIKTIREYIDNKYFVPVNLKSIHFDKSIVKVYVFHHLGKINNG